MRAAPDCIKRRLNLNAARFSRVTVHFDTSQGNCLCCCNEANNVSPHHKTLCRCGLFSLLARAIIFSPGLSDLLNSSWQIFRKREQTAPDVFCYIKKRVRAFIIQPLAGANAIFTRRCLPHSPPYAFIEGWINGCMSALRVKALFVIFARIKS